MGSEAVIPCETAAAFTADRQRRPDTITCQKVDKCGGKKYPLVVASEGLMMMINCPTRKLCTSTISGDQE